jgi:hypothetical protein
MRQDEAKATEVFTQKPEVKDGSTNVIEDTNGICYKDIGAG